MDDDDGEPEFFLTIFSGTVPDRSLQAVEDAIKIFCWTGSTGISRYAIHPVVCGAEGARRVLSFEVVASCLFRSSLQAFPNVRSQFLLTMDMVTHNVLRVRTNIVRSAHSSLFAEAVLVPGKTLVRAFYLFIFQLVVLNSVGLGVANLDNVFASAQRAGDNGEMGAPSRNDRWILLIGLFKLFKAALLIVTGIGILKLLHKDVAEVVLHWTDVFRVDPDNRLVQAALVKAFGLDDHKLKELGVGTFLYAGLFLTEGTGLLLRKRWAQYFTIIVTSSLLPIEVYELVHRPSAGKVIVILVNIAVVVYLAIRVKHEGGLE